MKKKEYVPITQAAIEAKCSPEAIYRMIRLHKIDTRGNKPKTVVVDEVVRILGRD